MPLVPESSLTGPLPVLSRDMGVRDLEVQLLSQTCCTGWSPRLGSGGSEELCLLP